jgi:putative hydrolase of the HAD superfamily
MRFLYKSTASDMKLITFDFWNTLFLDQHEEIRHKKRIGFAHKVLRKHRESLEQAEIREAFQAAHQEYLQQWDKRRAFTMDHHVSHILHCLQLEVPGVDFSSIVDYFESILLEHPPLVIENAVETVRFAASRTKVGLISDTGYSPGRTLRKILARNKMGDCFHAFSFSNETGVLKPNPIAFRRILEELDVPPQEAVHVGDLEDADIAGAKQIGMRAIRYIGADPEASRQSSADAVIDDLNQLSAVLDEL